MTFDPAVRLRQLGMSRDRARVTLDALELVPPPFVVDALCAQVDPEEFFPAKGGSPRAAKRICAGCPVQVECLTYALENNERYGIWGGVTERDRRRMHRAGAA